MEEEKVKDTKAKESMARITGKAQKVGVIGDKGPKGWSEWADEGKPGKGKGDKGLGKGKGPGDTKGKGKKGEKGDKPSGKGNVGNPHAGKQCHICKKYGHIANDCYWKVGAVESGRGRPTSSSGEHPSQSNTAERSQRGHYDLHCWRVQGGSRQRHR